MFESDPSTDENDQWLAQHALPDGTIVRFRPVRPKDEPLVTEAIRTASRETLLHRFFSPIRSVSPDLVRQMLALDAAREKCLVGVAFANGRSRIVCGARYIRLNQPDAAEIAITVHDDFQRCGLGRKLLDLLTKVAQRDGIRQFEADVMCSNQRMLSLFRKAFPKHKSFRQMGDVMHLTAELSQ